LAAANTDFKFSPKEIPPKKRGKRARKTSGFKLEIHTMGLERRKGWCLRAIHCYGRAFAKESAKRKKSGLRGRLIDGSGRDHRVPQGDDGGRGEDSTRGVANVYHRTALQRK